MSARRPDAPFSLDESNRMLPLVSAIVADWVALNKTVQDREQRMSHLTEGRDLASDSPYAEELQQVQRDLVESKQRLQEYLREMRELGVVPRDAVLGTVDFPAEESIGCFCWRLGEPEVRCRHEAGADCQTRKPVVVDLISGE